jgi:regulator of sigma E protease
MIGIESLGIALPVDFNIVHVDAKGPAAKAGLKPGDELTHVQFITEDADDLNKLKKFKLDKPLTLSQTNHNLVLITRALQGLPDSIQVEVTYQREGQKASTATIEPRDEGSGYLEDRGLNFAMPTEIHTADSVGEAFSLGLRETRDKLVEVARVLKRLVTGGIPADAVGGPITIARAAFMEASGGWGRLLIFLTLLSANLALINFLPIPVLDGGHMCFLAWEGITGKPANEKVQYYALLVGFAMLMCLTVYVFRNDIMNLL